MRNTALPCRAARWPPRREQAETAAKTLFDAGAKGVVVKAQIHAGGRGKGGGVKIAKSVDEAAELSRKMLGMRLVTHQTGPEGRIVRRLLIEETLPIEKEFYLGIVLDRAAAKHVFMASAAGGMEIEQVAAENPDAIIKEYIEPGMGLEPFQARKLAFKPGTEVRQLVNQAVQFMTALYKALLDTDASLVEINPFITTTDGRLFALDAKINFDDNALFRHPDIKELRDITEEDPLEVEASEVQPELHQARRHRGLHGQWRGAGDGDHGHHQYAGGMPANFLDVGGGANEDQVTHAFEILLSDKNVKAVLINIFGGILRVDTLANGVVMAATENQHPAADCAAAGRNKRRAGTQDPERLGTELHRRRNHERRSRKGRQTPRRARRHRRIR